MTDQIQESDIPAEINGATDTAMRRKPTNVMRIVGSGFLMGAADIVPGVSGGTVALILGVYERLLTAISRWDREMLRMLADRRWKAAAERVDLGFGVALGIGILAGAAGLATVMKHLLSDHRSLTYAAFAGMIMASSILVARRVSLWRMQTYGAILLGVIIAVRLVTLPGLQNPPDTYWYLFLCGMIGISAMILPGISGAFLLLLLRRYDVVLDAIRSLVHMEVTLATLSTIAVFGCGCVTGLLSFSRVLRWLLAHRHDTTMSLLCGFMVGSLYRLWPFQRDTTPQIADFKHKVFEHFMPDSVSTDVVLAMIVVVASAGLVLGLDAAGGRSRSHDDSTSDDLVAE